jgi:CheY-like chemotaxis protein
MNTFLTLTENTRWMIVDDNEQMLLMLSAVLKEKTSAAFTAEPGKYELVITDFEMPEMDGAELGRRLRALSLSLQIFLATGSGQFTEETAYDAGFNALLIKPFPVSELHAALAAAGLDREMAGAT